jgi:TrmH family RNA methyltransferase
MYTEAGKELAVTLITSPDNRYIRLYRGLSRRKARRETGLLPLEGFRLVEEAVIQGLGAEAVLLREGESPTAFAFLTGLPRETPVYHVEQALFARTAHTESPQGILALVRRPSRELADLFQKQPALLLVVDRLQDPGNLGTMIRSAAASGAGGVALLPGTVDAANPKVLRASMGACFRLPVVETGWAKLREMLGRHGVKLFAASGKAATSYDRVDWRNPVAVAVGNEGAGISAEITVAADGTVTVPMAGGVESLNAAIAMSVIFFEAARQRRGR